MQPIIECIPNFSEGQNQEVIDQIAAAIRGVEGVKLMHVDMGYSANRTVMTFAGAPDRVIEAAFRGIKEASKRIDMSTQSGTHPRMGATDVCPLVPIQGISFEEVLPYVEKLGHRVGNELDIPVYFYEKSALTPERQNLAFIRKGGYEGFQAKMLQEEWKPDAGPQRFHPQAGQTVIGVRDFLIAYNIHLDTQNTSLAKEIAREIRESGKIIQKNGVKHRVAGTCKGVKAIGWYVDEFGLAQVSTNVTDLGATPVHRVFEEVKKEAHKRGIRVRGSEIIGMIPKKVLIAAGKYYEKQENQSEESLIRRAIDQLGLSEFDLFDPSQKILEYQLKL
ncbi:MAG: glutamate formimidoyltransferase [Bacteroidota bacterium]